MKPQPGPTASRAFRSTEMVQKYIFGHPSDDRPLRALLNFRVRKPNIAKKISKKCIIMSISISNCFGQPWVGCKQSLLEISPSLLLIELVIYVMFFL
jgi:hypothetical protein